MAGTKVGPAENIGAAVPVIDAPEPVKAAEIATRELNAAFLTVMLGGRYTDAYLAEAGSDAPKFTAEELKVIATPVDFVGINVYWPNVYVAPSDEPPGYRTIPISASHPKMASAWHIVDLASCTGRHVTSDRCGIPSRSSSPRTAAPPRIVIAEDGHVDDTDRVMFLRACLTQLQRATSEGIPVSGYFLWSAQDNFEWIWGYGDRFGIVHVDFETLERTPKHSAHWFRQTARQNAVA